MSRVGLSARVTRLEAERDITQALFTYGHAIDYGWADEYRGLFTDDAVLYWPGQPMRGIDEIMAGFAAHSHAPRVFHKHFLAGPIIVVEGDQANVQSMFARLDDYSTEPGLCAFGRYRDVMVRGRDGRWRFAVRHASIEAWRHGEPPVRSDADPLTGTVTATAPWAARVSVNDHVDEAAGRRLGSAP